MMSNLALVSILPLSSTIRNSEFVPSDTIDWTQGIVQHSECYRTPELRINVLRMNYYEHRLMLLT